MGSTRKRSRPHLYLASQSPRRRELLAHLDRSFTVVHSTHRETIRKAATPEANAMRNAWGKAKKARLPPKARGIVIGADTFLWFRGHVIGKPKSIADTKRIWAQLSGRTHWVYTGLCLWDPAGGRIRKSFERSQVTFRKLTPALMDTLLKRIHPLDKAGGYAVQGDNGRLIARIQGSRSNVMGLPLERLSKELALFEKPVRQRCRY